MMKAIAVVVALLAVVGVLVVNQPAQAVGSCGTINYESLTLELVEVKVDGVVRETFEGLEDNDFLLQSRRGGWDLDFVIINDEQTETVHLRELDEGGDQ